MGCKSSLRIKLLVFFLLDVADLVADWLQYYDVSRTADGLVYGVFDNSVKYSLLVFSVIGTVLFIIESVFYCYDWKHIHTKNKSTKIGDIVALISTWVEDVPQIIITVKIAACREEAVSGFQLMKASFCILECLVKFGFGCWDIYQKKKDNRYSAYIYVFKEKGFYLKAINVVGLVIMFLGALCVFGLTHFKYDKLKGINFRNHDKIFNEDVETQEYFKDVHVFLNFNETENVPSMSKNNWIELNGLENIVTMDTTSIVRIEYDTGKNTYLKMETSNSRQFPTFDSNECYKRQSGQWVVIPCSDDLFAGRDTNLILTYFKFEQSNPHKILGDVAFNYKLLKRNCEPINSPKAPFRLQYFKIKDVPKVSFLAQETTGVNARFYETDSDLQDIYDVWKTGNFKCSCTARKFPEYASTLRVNCK